MGPSNLAIRISSISGDLGECQIWDLGLADTFEGVGRFRKPFATPHFLRFSLPSMVQLSVNEDYVLVGAAVKKIWGPLPSLLVWPKVTQTTGHVRLSTAVPMIGEIVELFAGGINAWSRATAQLPISVTLKIDCKDLAIQMSQLNADNSVANQERDQPELVCSDVADMTTLSRLSNEEAFVASPPCQPFSSMGMGQGLDAPSAVAWDRFFVALRLAQRRYVVLENVCGLTKHADFQEIIRAILYCGYILVSRRTCDASAVGCASRPRVMLIFWNNADWKETGQSRPHVPLVSELGSPMPCVQVGSVWQDIPGEIAQDLLLSDEDTILLRQRELLPRCLQCSPKDPLSLRVVCPARPMPSVTAAYHRSAQLPVDHVKAKGLHVPLVRHGPNHRRLSKWEVLHSLGIDMGIILPAEEHVAISVIGESFPPLHAFEALLLALTLHPARPMTQSQVDNLFWSGLQHLSPKDPCWDTLSQVQYQGWAKLCVKGREEREQSNLARLVQQLWKQQSMGCISFVETCLAHSHALPKEASYFYQEAAADTEMQCTLRPGWPARWIPLSLDDGVSQWHVVQYVAEVWGIDPWVTLAVRAKGPQNPRIILVDEIADETVSMRLVMCEEALPRAVWCKAFPSLADLVDVLGVDCKDIFVNGCRRIEPHAPIHDGDVVHATPHAASEAIFWDTPDMSLCQGTSQLCEAQRGMRKRKADTRDPYLSRQPSWTLQTTSPMLRMTATHLVTLGKAVDSQPQCHAVTRTWRWDFCPSLCLRPCYHESASQVSCTLSQQELTMWAMVSSQISPPCNHGLTPSTLFLGRSLYPHHVRLQSLQSHANQTVQGQEAHPVGLGLGPELFL